MLQRHGLDISAYALPWARWLAQRLSRPLLELARSAEKIAAVAAACAAADRGAQVMLIAPRPYLGDDLCGRQHLWIEEGEQPASELAKALFPSGRVTTPFTIKGALDKQLGQLL